MNFLPIHELAIVDIADWGVAGRERIALRPTEPVDLGQFILVIAFQNAPNAATPYKNAAIWLGNFHVEPPAWVIVFTGQAPANTTSEPVDYIDPQIKQRVLLYYLGLPAPIFDNPGIMPLLFRVTGVQLGRAPVTPQHLAIAPGDTRR